MLLVQHLAYAHPGKEQLFSNLGLVINKYEKIALVGNNGSGKSTLLKILAGVLQPSGGTVSTGLKRYYVPQHFGQFNDRTVAEALQVDGKLQALEEILSGDVNAANMTLLDDDWGIAERCAAALAAWQLAGIDVSRPMSSLSGGQKTRVFLAGIAIHEPGIVLLDEPSNHLDLEGRALLYDYIRTTTHTLLVVSHDRTLLNLLHPVFELSGQGIAVYGGNYDHYKEQKAAEANALAEALRGKEKALRKARETERAAMERQQKLDARGRKKQDQAGVPTIALNTLRNNAEKSTSRMKEVHADKVAGIAGEVNQLRRERPDKDKMRISFEDAALHRGKLLIRAAGLNFACGDRLLWERALDFEIASGQRVAVRGANGSGKTTLIRMLLQELQPTAGVLQIAALNAIYIDQDYSLVGNGLSVYDQAQVFNTAHLPEHEVKSRLTHFLFTKAWWDRPCAVLSGGEKMRLLLCCLTMGMEAPDLIILDEPTNNLDLQNIGILTDALHDYTGTMIVVSHDAVFLEEIGIDSRIEL